MKFAVDEFGGVKKHDTHASAPVGGNTDLCTTKLIYIYIYICVCVCLGRFCSSNRRRRECRRDFDASACFFWKNEKQKKKILDRLFYLGFHTHAEEKNTTRACINKFFFSSLCEKTHSRDGCLLSRTSDDLSRLLFFFFFGAFLALGKLGI